MSNANSFLTNILLAVGLVLIPIFSTWWVFLPLGFVVTFFFERTVASLVAAFILDSFYFGGNSNHLPSLTLFIFGILIVRTALRDRLRL